MPKIKRYTDLSRRQVFRRLAAQWKVDVHRLHNSSSDLTNKLYPTDDISYIRQEQAEGKNNILARVNNESEGMHNCIENVIDTENIELNHYNEIMQSMSDSRCYETDSEEEFLEDDSEFIEDDTFNFVEELKLFAVQCEIKHVHLNRLLQLLQKAGFNNLPTNVRTLLQTPRTSNSEMSPCLPGEYLHYGLKKAIEMQLYDSTCFDKTELMFDINIDGLPIAKSSATCLWPILGKLVHKSSKSTPFIIGIYHGNKKPSSVQNYLTPFINEYKQLQDEGIVINGIQYNVTLRCIICDSPARSYVKCTKQFNGYFSCDKCTEEGEYLDRMVFLSESAPVRTDDSFRSRTNEEHHTGISPFEYLPIDMIKQFPLDSLHVVYLGVMKALLMNWLNNNRCPRFSSQAVQKLSDLIVISAQWVSKDFNRKPRGLQELCRWKGTEFRFFLLYLGPIILQHFLPREYLIHFNSLNCAIRILCDPRDCYRNNAYAKELLIYFVQQFQTLYGEQYVTSNIHYLIHINEDVRMYGSLDSYSTFDFENYMQVLKRMLRKHANPLQQIHRRLLENRNCVQLLQNNNKPKIVKYPVLKNPVISELPLGCHSEHRILQFHTFELSNKRPENCCFMKDATIVMIKHICFMENMIVILGNKFLKKCDILHYPCPSSNMNIYEVDNLSSLQMWRAQCIDRKGFMQYFVVFFDDFCNLIPENWMDLESNNVFWPPKHIKFNKHKMHLLQPDDDWLIYKCRKRLGPFESLQIANEIEEHCINVSTSEDTEDMCKKGIKANETQNTRRRKKPAYLEDMSDKEQDDMCQKAIKARNKTRNARKKKKQSYFSDVSEEEQITENKYESVTSSFALPPSNYHLHSSDEREFSPIIARRSSVNALPEHLTIDTTEMNNMSAPTAQSGKKISIVEALNVDKTTENISGSSKQCSTGNTTALTHIRKRTSIVEVENVDKTIENISGSPKQRRTGNMISNTELGISANPVLPRSVQNRPIQDQQVQERNHKREPLTEERYLTYHKSLNTKLNQIMNLLKARRTEVADEMADEEESLLPNFPLKTVQEFEQFQQNLIESLEIKNLYIREIKMIGGNDPGKFTRAVLRYVMSDELALEYSWSGQRSTKKLKNTQISLLIVDTISKVKNVPRNDVDNFIKKWLQHAGDRLKNL